MSHPLDRALGLQADAAQPDVFHGATSPDYWNMVGPFGGTTAATLLQAVWQHPGRLGTPVALTANYAAALGPGPFRVRATPVRTNRSTQHWVLEIAQPDDQGVWQVNTTGTAFTALRRATWGATDQPMPAVPPAAEVPRIDPSHAPVEWLRQYDMRFIGGAIPARWDGAQMPSETLLWFRDAQPRTLDFPALAAFSDVFYPRVWLRRATRVPAGTVSITTYFHADEADLAAAGTGYVLGRASGQQFHHGYFDQTAHLWSEAGRLLATSNQIVYYKE
jgi:hypothetical protein